MGKPILEMRGIDKVYSNGVYANRGVDFSLESGEIHSLLGENGAGKSTLMKVLFGMETHESGQIILRGDPVNIRSPAEAIVKGIGMVHQHFMLLPSLTVAENLVLGMEPRKHKWFFDQEKAVAETNNIASKYGFQLDARAKIAQLPMGLRQQVEILKALYRGARILILDEPTAVLTPQETHTLFQKLRALTDEGHTVVFISHKLDEIKAICDRITIMRKGRNVGCYRVADISTQEMSRLMVGRDVSLEFEASPAQPKEVRLKVEALSVYNPQGQCRVDHISFQLRAGEILGIAGVEGNGQHELVEALTALVPYQGSVNCLGREVSQLGIKQLRDCGLAHIPADRISCGSVAQLDILHNLMANQYDRPELSRRGLLRWGKMRARAKEMVQNFQVACYSLQQPVSLLSGGNIQKVVVARELSVDPKVVIANQPTRGIDVGAAEFVRRRLLQLRDQGCAILMVSADLNEVMGISDRLAVMYKGKVVGLFDEVGQLSEEELGQYMLGLKNDSSLEARQVGYERPL